MAKFKFCTPAKNMIEFDYNGEDVFNVKVNGKSYEANSVGLIKIGGSKQIHFYNEKPKAIVFIPQIISEWMDEERDFFID